MTKKLEERLAILERELARARAQDISPAFATKSDLAVSQKKDSNSKKIIVIITTCFLLIVATAGLYLFMSKPEPSASSTSKIALTKVQAGTAYPLHYPADLPDKFQFVAGSLDSKSSFVSFSLISPTGSTWIVTQQERPPVMEQVKLVGEDGKDNLKPGRYVADFEGNYTGILLTDKTLLLINGAEKSEIDQLEQLLAVFKEV